MLRAPTHFRARYDQSVDFLRVLSVIDDFAGPISFVREKNQFWDRMENDSRIRRDDTSSEKPSEKPSENRGQQPTVKNVVKNVVKKI